MSNKYQEALDNVKIAPSFMGGNTKYSTNLNSATPFSEDISILQELVNKATPKKRIFVDATPSISAHDECPVCRVKVSPIRHYCDNCGQRLE